MLKSFFPGRLCDGPSSPCRPQDTSCWARPATSSSCWMRRRRRRRRAWRCLRRAGSGSCRACCWERSPTEDGLHGGGDNSWIEHTDETITTYLIISLNRCSLETWQMLPQLTPQSLSCSVTFCCPTLPATPHKALLLTTITFPLEMNKYNFFYFPHLKVHLIRQVPLDVQCEPIRLVLVCGSWSQSV